jgi:hypothetical protein
VICSTCRFSSASCSFVESSSLRSSVVCGDGVVLDARDDLLIGVESNRHSRSNCHISLSRDLTSGNSPGTSTFCVIARDCSISPFSRTLSLFSCSRLLSKSVTVESLTVNCSFRTVNFYKSQQNFLRNVPEATLYFSLLSPASHPEHVAIASEIRHQAASGHHRPFALNRDSLDYLYRSDSSRLGRWARFDMDPLLKHRVS